MISKKETGSNRIAYFCFVTVIVSLIIWIWTLRLASQNNYHPFYCILNNSRSLYTQQHEVARRHLDHSIRQLYYFLNDQVSKSANNSEFKEFGEEAIEETISLIAEFDNFGSKVDNAVEWHNSELKKLTNFIQKRIHALQHPKSCANTKILICELNLMNCGLACIIHRVGYCLRYAAISNRTLIIENNAKGWKYSKQGWEAVYKSISNCTNRNIAEKKENIKQWTSVEQLDRVTILKDGWCEEGFDNKTHIAPKWLSWCADTATVHRPEQLALSFPKQIADKLLTHHSNPPLFFGAQFFWYTIRLNAELQSLVEKAAASINLASSPIVGIQIRRTDKLNNEAAFFGVEKYFEWAELWFKVQEKKNPDAPKLKRRVFIATDDLGAINEAKKRYPHYEINANSHNAQSAQLKTRYTEDSLHGIIADYHVLSKCDYVVCTMSSNICRLVYEMMQVDRGDVANSLHSLDLSYFNHFQMPQEFVATEDNQAKNDNELSFKINDTIKLPSYGKGNLWNGQSNGFINDSDKSKTYPSYKVQEKWRIIDFPLFGIN